MTTPNLFNFAPSELSQDAFFAWLLSFADKKYQHEFLDLHQVSQALLLAFIKKCRPNFQIDIRTIQIKRQYKFKVDKNKRVIDILIVINEKYSDEFRIIIESKTSSKEYGNQLYNYAQYAKNQDWNFIGIYLKTGNEATCFLNKISEKTKEFNMRFEIFNRQDILSILNTDKSIKNDIYN